MAARRALQRRLPPSGQVEGSGFGLWTARADGPAADGTGARATALGTVGTDAGDREELGFEGFGRRDCWCERITIGLTAAAVAGVAAVLR